MDNIARQKEPPTPTTRERIAAQEPLTGSIDALRAYLRERGTSRTFGPGDFEGFERRVLELGRGVMREAIADELRAADEAAEAIEIAGVSMRRVLRSPQTYMTAAGEVTVDRWLFKDRSDVDAHAIAPLDLRAGVVAGFWTPEAAKQGLWVVSQMTPKKGAELFERAGTMRPSKSSLDRLPKAVSELWEAERATLEEKLREKLPIPANATTLAVSLDGVLAPMEGTAPTAKRAQAAAEGRTAKGPVGYREIGCAALSFCDAKGDLIAAVRMARAPEVGKASLKAQIVADVMAILARRPELQVVKIADGVADNWTFLDELVPEGRGVLDFFHASEHLHAAIAAAYGDGTRETRHRYETLRDQLRDDDDGVASVTRALAYLARKHPKSEVLRRAVAYFRKNKRRMKYAELKTLGFPIGSGVVEATCKTLVTQRLKLSGMRWSTSGAQAILTTRGWDQSERFDEAWALVAAHYHVEVHVLAHVIPVKRASR
jgi:hypothetical protein